MQISCKSSNGMVSLWKKSFTGKTFKFEQTSCQIQKRIKKYRIVFLDPTGDSGWQSEKDLKEFTP